VRLVGWLVGSPAIRKRKKKIQATKKYLTKKRKQTEKEKEAAERGENKQAKITIISSSSRNFVRAVLAVMQLKCVYKMPR